MVTDAEEAETAGGRDSRYESGREDMARLFINIGKNQNVKPGTSWEPSQASQACRVKWSEALICMTSIHL